MVSLLITVGCKRWYVVGLYVHPNNKLTVHWVEQVLACGTVRVAEMLVGDRNVQLVQP